MIWQDNNTDIDGLGIRALALDTNLVPIQPAFRVNHFGARDQENPRAALLQDGGAVFVWQSGRASFQRVYARFLSSSNTWTATDVSVSTNRHPQSSPAVAVLDNGNVAIVWASVDAVAPGSMRDVFGQIFTPLGQKVGAEFRVNQFTSYNQRDPAIAALTGGRFVVAWVTEQQSFGGGGDGVPVTIYSTNVPPVGSVDIFYRLFQSDGTPSSPEQPINTGVEICANPAVGAGSDGGFIVAWSQKSQFDLQNGWDVVARACTNIAPNIPTPGAPSRTINTHIPGDQFAPHIASSGTDYLVIWTSTGQDGSGNRVYGQFLAPDGSLSGSEFRVNTTTRGNQIDPALTSDGAGRFLALWSGFAGLRAGLDLYGQRYSSPDFSSPATANLYHQPPSEAFDDVTIPGSEQQGFDPPPVITPRPVDSYTIAKATYSGLFYDRTNGLGLPSSGGIILGLTAQGSYTATLRLGVSSWTATGRLYRTNGHASATINRGQLAPLKLDLQLDSSGAVLPGSITDGNWISDLTSLRSVASNTNRNLRTKYAGTYTFDLPGDSSGLLPGGDGYGTVTVDSAGTATWFFSLADGQKFIRVASLSDNGVCAVYAPLYGGKGSALSWLQFTTNGLNGQLMWLAQSNTSARYSAGFTNQLDLAGWKYKRPGAGERVLGWPNGNLLVNGRTFSLPLSIPVTIDSLNGVHSSTRALKLTLYPATGVFSGSFLNPSSGKTQTFQGALFRDRKLGRGYFLAPDGSGQVSIEAAQ